jgi:hypothetical protein
MQASVIAETWMSDTLGEQGYAANSAKRGEPEHYPSMVRYRAESADLQAKDRSGRFEARRSDLEI